MGHRLNGFESAGAATRLAISPQVQPPPPPPGWVAVDPVLATSVPEQTHGVGRAVRWMADRTRHAWRLPPDSPWDIDWAWSAGALQLAADVVTDPQGRGLLGADVDVTAEIPVPPDARVRHRWVATTLANRNIDPPPSVPGAGQSEVQLRVPADVAARALALFLVAVRGEAVATDHPLDPTAMLARSPIGAASLDAHERRLFDDQPSPEQSQMAGWCYESLAALLWAMGRLARLPWPDQRQDIADLIRPMTVSADADFVDSTTLRPLAEVLDQMELHRGLWQTLVAGGTPPGVDAGVVGERLIALTWLASDQVPTHGTLPGDWPSIRQAVLGSAYEGRTAAWLM